MKISIFTERKESFLKEIRNEKDLCSLLTLEPFLYTADGKKSSKPSPLATGRRLNAFDRFQVQIPKNGGSCLAGKNADGP